MTVPSIRSTILAVVALLLPISVPDLARAHYSYDDAALIAMSPDGELGLFVVEAGDTEGGAEGETLVIARIGPGVTPTGLVSILGGDHEVLVAHQEVLPYIPSPGTMMEHSPQQVDRAPKLRAAFMAGPAVEHGVTVAPSTRALPRAADGTFDTGGGGNITVALQGDRRARLGRGGASVTIAAPWREDLTCVEAVYRTDDPSVFVIQIFAYPVQDPAACPADRREHFGPPPTRSFFRVDLAAGPGKTK